MPFSKTVSLARALIQKPSVTPNDCGCQQMIAKQMALLGFKQEFMPFGDVSNLWLRKGNTEPLLVLAGHTDVVPTGLETAWKHPPFAAMIEDGLLYGRGAVDMKGGLAAMMIAVENFLNMHPMHNGSIAFLITSDEEGRAINGTRKVVEILKKRNEIPNWCVIGEPSSTHYVGDIIKHGRRGSLSAKLSIIGVQGHVAYPHLADNPNHRAIEVLNKLINIEWDKGNDDFPPTSFQIVNLKSGTNANNVIPGMLETTFNFRFSNEVTADELKKRVLDILHQHQVNFNIDWVLSGHPFLTPDGMFRSKVSTAIESVSGKTLSSNTAGGTSDGRFIAELGTEIVELGLKNETIHKVNEHVAVEDLDLLTSIYVKVLESLLL